MRLLGSCVREKRHRLPREHYRGWVTVAFTIRVKHDLPLFQEAEVVDAFVRTLRSAAGRNCCLVPVYCFMPEHLHLIVHGTTTSADTWRTVVNFKQYTGFWLSQQRRAARWQKDFYDHVIRAEEDMAAQIRYVANNPVRRGLVEDWQSYPFTGSIGMELCAVIEGLITV